MPEDGSDLGTTTAAIFAGGLGTRLRSQVDDRPKVLAEVRGRAFLSYLLDQLAAAGLRSVVVCTGYMGDRVRAEFGDSYGPLRLRYSQEDAPLGTAGALRLARHLLESDPVLVMNGDSICRADLEAFRIWHREKQAEASILLTEVPDTGRYGRVTVDEAGALIAFEEKQNAGGPGWINAGVYLLSDRLIRAIPSGRAVSLEREVLPDWIGKRLFGHRSEARFLDIGTPESYARAERFFGQGEQT